jgi:hypothetical protein
VILPLLDTHLSPARDEYAWGRYVAMKDRYGV